jgi:hypothetical protein
MSDTENKEVLTEEIEVPDCFSFHDVKDPSCRRCSVRFLCAEEKEATRPPCFGKLWDESNQSCLQCLDASECVEQLLEKENDNMSPRKIKVRRTKPKPKLEPEPKVEEEEMDYGSMKIQELREECEERGLESGGRKSMLLKRLMADDIGEDEDEEEEAEEVEEEAEEVEEPKAKAKAKPARRRKKVAAPKVEELEEEDEPEVVKAGANVFADLLECLESGQALLVTKTSKNKYQITSGAATAVTAVKGRGITGSEFEKTAFSEEYYTYLYEDAGDGKSWKEMTPEERYAFAEVAEADWEEHENPKTDQMRMGQAVREALGIEKWKPQYASRSVRKALKEFGITAS